LNWKRVGIWLGIAAAITLLAWLVWFILSLIFAPQQQKPGGMSWVPSTLLPISTPGIPPKPGDGDSGDGDENRRVIPKLRQLSDTPVAGSRAFEQAGTALRAGTTIFRWIDRATGHIYEARSNDATELRVSNTTIPSVQEGFFSDDGQSVVVRYLKGDNDTIETLVGQIASVTEKTSNGYVYNETKLVTRYLEPNILAAGDSEQPNRYYTLLSRGNGGSIVAVGDYATGTPKAIFESPLAQWAVSWAKDRLAVQTKPGSDDAGYLFFVAADGEQEKIIENRQGLTTLVNPSATRVLFSETVNNDLRLWVKNLENGSERLLELRTLPEKCSWSPEDETVVLCGAPDFYVRGPYPTNWYQGRFSFDDNIWAIDVDTERYELLYDTRVGQETFDIWRPSVSPNGGFLVFQNKRDLSLWSLDLGDSKVVNPPAAPAATATTTAPTAATSTPSVSR
jgi:hypothetical protein